MLSQCDLDIQERMVNNFPHPDEDYERRVAEGLGLDFEKQKAAQTT